VHFRDPPPQENNYRKFSPLYRVLKWLLATFGAINEIPANWKDYLPPDREQQVLADWTRQAKS
jgi:hypothetical protein